MVQLDGARIGATTRGQGARLYRYGAARRPVARATDEWVQQAGRRIGSAASFPCPPTCSPGTRPRPTGEISHPWKDVTPCSTSTSSRKVVGCIARVLVWRPQIPDARIHF